MKKNILKYLTFFISSSVLIFIDQVTKKIAFDSLYNKKPVVLIDNILELVYVENRGAAFGILQNKQILFYILTVLVIFILIYNVYKLEFNLHNIYYFIFFILLFAGAIGNFIDRLKNKYVVDFIYFKPIDFPVFNFADICITISCLLIIYSMIFIYKGDNK